MSALAVKSDTNAVAEVQDINGGLLDVIARAARDPSVDIDKMERLLEMQERVQARQAEIAFSEALAIMQPQLPTISKRGQIVHKGQVISEFAEWSDISKAITPILSQHGFSLSFKPARSGSEVQVTAILRHRAGYKDEATLPLPTDTTGAKNAVQAVGSSLTYGKRYAAILILNIQQEGEDDDGSASGPVIQHQAPRDAPFPQGPARNKSELKTMARAVWRDVEGCGDSDMLDIVLSDGKSIIAQLKAALPSWWDGGMRGDEKFEGLGEVITRKQMEFMA